MLVEERHCHKAVMRTTLSATSPLMDEGHHHKAADRTVAVEDQSCGNRIVVQANSDFDVTPAARPTISMPQYSRSRQRVIFLLLLWLQFLPKLSARTSKRELG